MKDGRDAVMVGHRTDGTLVARPLSPHLQNYRWPVSMALSIAHREDKTAVLDAVREMPALTWGECA